MFGECLTTDRHYIAIVCQSHFRTRVPDSYCLESTGKKQHPRRWTVTDTIGGHLTNHVFVYRNKDRSICSFIFPVIYNWKQPWLTSAPKSGEIDRDKKEEKEKNGREKAALNRGVHQSTRLLTLINGVDINFRRVWLWPTINVNFSKALTFRNADSLIGFF